MTEHETHGNEIRGLAKSLVLNFMRATPDCQAGRDGLKLSQIFRACGLDWGKHKNATSSNQQYWVVALVRELEAEGFVERVTESGPWRLL